MPPYGKNVRAMDQLMENDKKDEEISQHEPSMHELNLLIREVVSSSSWWDLHGVDLAIMFLNLGLLPFGYLLLGCGSMPLFVLGHLLLSYIHATFTVKLAHAALHNALAGSSRFINRLLSMFFIEIWGGFTDVGSYEAHIKLHHPYTNIIGLGDSSSWRAPFLGRNMYLFFAPLFLPPLYLIVGLKMLAGRWWLQTRFLFVVILGHMMHFCLFRYGAGLSTLWSLLCNFSVRGVFSIPYIHVNIFQHIGLPMYDVKKQPTRLYRLASAVLNLQRNPLLDFNFGHSFFSCHIEHHLFPHLSDNMCLKIQPVVSSYFKKHGLPYNEATYSSRLRTFYSNYEELMVKAPPITEFIGIQ